MSSKNVTPSSGIAAPPTWHAAPAAVLEVHELLRSLSSGGASLSGPIITDLSPGSPTLSRDTWSESSSRKGASMRDSTTTRLMAPERWPAKANAARVMRSAASQGSRRRARWRQPDRTPQRRPRPPTSRASRQSHRAKLGVPMMWKPAMFARARATATSSEPSTTLSTPAGRVRKACERCSDHTGVGGRLPDEECCRRPARRRAARAGGLRVGSREVVVPEQRHLLLQWTPGVDHAEEPALPRIVDHGLRLKGAARGNGNGSGLPNQVIDFVRHGLEVEQPPHSAGESEIGIEVYFLLARTEAGAAEQVLDQLFAVAGPLARAGVRSRTAGRGGLHATGNHKILRLARKNGRLAVRGRGRSRTICRP